MNKMLEEQREAQRVIDYRKMMKDIFNISRK